MRLFRSLAIAVSLVALGWVLIGRAPQKAESATVLAYPSIFMEGGTVTEYDGANWNSMWISYTFDYDPGLTGYSLRAFIYDPTTDDWVSIQISLNGVDAHDNPQIWQQQGDGWQVGVAVSINQINDNNGLSGLYYYLLEGGTTYIKVEMLDNNWPIPNVLASGIGGIYFVTTPPPGP